MTFSDIIIFRKCQRKAFFQVMNFSFCEQQMHFYHSLTNCTQVLLTILEARGFFLKSGTTGELFKSSSWSGSLFFRESKAHHSIELHLIEVIYET